MDLESLETQTLLKKRTPMRQSLALKLAVLLCGLGLFVGVAVPSTNQGLQGAATLKETQKVTATAGVSSTSRPASTEFVASAEYEDVNSTYWRGLVTSVENEWYGTQAGSMVDVLILQSNYPADIVKTVVEADNANWFFTNVYGPLAASQAAGAAPIIKAWLAGEELPATFP